MNESNEWRYYHHGFHIFADHRNVSHLQRQCNGTIDNGYALMNRDSFNQISLQQLEERTSSLTLFQQLPSHARLPLLRYATSIYYCTTP
jgi:hypothetical protein